MTIIDIPMGSSPSEPQAITANSVDGATFGNIDASHLDATSTLAGRLVTLPFGATQNSHASALPAAHG